MSTVAKSATVRLEGGREVTRLIEYYNLDMILSVGYRVNSIKATVFRQWATKLLREYIVKGYAINRKRIANNYDSFLKAVENVRVLLPPGSQIDTASILELIKLFADTWFSLAAYDKGSFGKEKITKKKVVLAAADLSAGIAELKSQLIKKGGEACGGCELTGKSSCLKIPEIWCSWILSIISIFGEERFINSQP